MSPCPLVPPRDIARSRRIRRTPPATLTTTPQRRYLVALHEATDTLHRSMCLAPYLPGGMVVAIAVESATLYYIVD
jgi:hypothetical protein